MNMSMFIDDELDDPENLGAYESAIVINNDDVEETLFDINSNGIYLYPVYMQKFGDYDTHKLEHLKILGWDIVT